jgi:hypothetical protein
LNATNGSTIGQHLPFLVVISPRKQNEYFNNKSHITPQRLRLNMQRMQNNILYYWQL